MMLPLSFLAFAQAALGPTVTLRGGVVMPSVGTGAMGGCGPDSFGTPDNVSGCNRAGSVLEFR